MKFIFFIFLSISAVSYSASSHFFIGSNYTYIHFKPRGISSSHGNLGGVQANYEYWKENSIYEGIKLTYRQGNLTGSPYKRNILDIDSQGRIGYTLKCSNFLLTPFSGFGWRYISQDFRHTNEYNLKFSYNEVYIPIGIHTDFRIRSFFSIGLKGTWMPQIFSSVGIKPIGNVHWDLERCFGNMMVELPMTFYFPRQKIDWTLHLNPFFQFWENGKTSAKTIRGISLGLPSNIYKLLGIEVNLRCTF